ncbi:hypothetical protein CCR84_05290 [Rhodocyclus purpureus]|nr:hypothetical protein [Rhodocyclus purpureus]
MSWFRRAVLRLQGDLNTLAKELEVSTDDWPLVSAHARSTAACNPAVAAAWEETEDRVIELASEPRPIYVMFGAPRDLWSANALLSRSMNFALAEAVPNLLVGIGLLFTFLFLTLALTQATSALVAQSGQVQADLLIATRDLLGAAGSKFLTSLAGLFASILWAIAARRDIAKVKIAADRVLHRVGRMVGTGGGEKFMHAQLQISRDLHQTSSRTADQAGDLLGLNEELLEELREQTGTFKRFETDLAVSLAGAITQAFSPQMEAMTSRLIGAIDGLSEKIGTMNQEALQQMLEDFSTMLKQTTDSEMMQLRQALEALSGRLSMAGEAIGEGAAKAADRLDKAGADLMAGVEHVAVNLSKGAENLAGATQGIKEAMNDLDVTICQASDLGKQGADFVRGALETADTAFGRLQSVAEQLTVTGGALERLSGQLAEAVDSVEEMTLEQRAVVNAVKDATPQAMASVQRLLDLLQQTVQLTASMMSEAKESMASTSKTLGATVAEITVGVSEYSLMVAELHRKMDDQLAKAVGSLDKGIVGLEEAVEEVGEVLDARLTTAEGILDKGIVGMEEAIKELGEVLDGRLARA